MPQNEFEFTKEYPPQKPLPKDTMCILSVSDLKNHVLSLVKLFCMGICTKDSCKDCMLDQFRLFVSRMPGEKFYAAPLECNIPVVVSRGEGMPSEVQDELNMSTERFGMVSFMDTDKIQEMAAQIHDPQLPVPTPEEE